MKACPNCGRSYPPGADPNGLQHHGCAPAAKREAPDRVTSEDFVSDMYRHILTGVQAGTVDGALAQGYADLIRAAATWQEKAPKDDASGLAEFQKFARGEVSGEQRADMAENKASSPEPVRADPPKAGAPDGDDGAVPGPTPRLARPLRRAGVDGADRAGGGSRGGGTGRVG